FAFQLFEVFEKHRRGEEGGNRNIEEDLDLLAVQIHREHAGGAGGHEQVGDEFGRDGYPGLVFAVLSRVAVKRHDGGDALGRGAARGVDHDEQLHQVMVRRRAGGLDDVDILAPDVFVDLYKRLAIGETGDRG